jgi:hypothetical protein
MAPAGTQVSLNGRVPVRYDRGDDIETNTLPFCIESEITRGERYREKTRTAKAMRYQQWVALLREKNASAAPRPHHLAAPKSGAKADIAGGPSSARLGHWPDYSIT